MEGTPGLQPTWEEDLDFARDVFFGEGDWGQVQLGSQHVLQQCGPGDQENLHSRCQMRIFQA
jgi:hypothetical protein